MNSRVNIFVIAAAILLAALMPVVFIATLLFLVAPSLLIARPAAFEVVFPQPLALRTLPLFRAPPVSRV